MNKDNVFTAASAAMVAEPIGPGRKARLLDGLSRLVRAVPDAEVGEIIRLLEKEGQSVLKQPKNRRRNLCSLRVAEIAPLRQPTELMEVH